MMDRFKAFSALAFLLLASSGCVAESVEEDSLAGEVLNTFGNFSSDNGSTSYEFSLGSVADKAMAGPIDKVLGDFKQNVSQQEGVTLKSTEVEVENVSTDSADVRIIYQIESEDMEDMEQDISFTLVREGGTWTIKDPISYDRFNTSYNPRQQAPQ